MAKAKQGSKRKHSKTALPVWAAAGVSLAMTGGASANAPATDVPSEDFGKRILLAEEEVFDVSLGTFYVFDKEREFSPGVRFAGGRCGGCGGHGGGCGGHGGGCGCHMGGCHMGGGCHVGGCHVGGCGCSHRGCRGCGGCGVGMWIGGCGGCGGGYGTCWVWSPALGRWINVCY